MWRIPAVDSNAGVTQLVECNLAKVDVEGSNPFTRSCFHFGILVDSYHKIVTHLHSLFPFLIPVFRLKWVAFLSIAFSFFIIAGGPLLVLQGVAWTGMVQEYSKNDTLANALQKTFSGKYRCSLCQKIAEAKNKEQKSTASFKIKKSLKASLLSHFYELLFLFGKKTEYPWVISLDYRSIIQEPPTPYPRAL